MPTIEKLYYSIGEVAEELGITKSVIRYWENEFDFIKPGRNSRGERKFTKKTMSELRIVHHLIKEKGFTINGAKKELSKNKEFHRKVEQTIQKLEGLKKNLTSFVGLLDD